MSGLKIVCGFRNRGHLQALGRLALSWGMALEAYSPPRAGISWGASFFSAVVDRALPVLSHRHYPVPPVVWLDCAQEAGAVLQALATDVPHIVCQLPQPVINKLNDIAGPSQCIRHMALHNIVWVPPLLDRKAIGAFIKAQGCLHPV